MSRRETVRLNWNRSYRKTKQVEKFVLTSETTFITEVTISSVKTIPELSGGCKTVNDS